MCVFLGILLAGIPKAEPGDVIMQTPRCRSSQNGVGGKGEGHLDISAWTA